MNPEIWYISADEAIDHFRENGFLCTSSELPGFHSFDSEALSENKKCELKKIYDSILLNSLHGLVEFYVRKHPEPQYKNYSLDRNKFESWLSDWWYNDDLVLLCENRSASVFHHSGYVFYFQSEV